MTVENRGTLVALEGARERHHGDPVRDQLGPVVAQPVLQPAHTVLLRTAIDLCAGALASPVVVPVFALRQGRIVGAILVAAAVSRCARQFQTAAGRRAGETFAAGRPGAIASPVLRLPRKPCRSRHRRRGDQVADGWVAAVDFADAMCLGVLVDGLVGQTSRLARFLASDSHVGTLLYDSCSVLCNRRSAEKGRWSTGGLLARTEAAHSGK